MEEFYIVPTTNTYYDKISAKDKQDAVVQFADSMDFDMSAYFKAVEEEPSAPKEQTEPQIYGYEYPEGDFQVAMTIIADTMAGKKESTYYTEGLLDELTINVEELASLQASYELFRKYLKSFADYFGEFSNILHLMTGFNFDKDEDKEESKVRILITGEDLKTAGNILAAACVDGEWLDDNRLLVSSSDVEDAISVLEENGFKASII